MRSYFKHLLLLVLSITLLVNHGCYQAQPVVDRTDNSAPEDTNTKESGSETVPEDSEDTAVREKIEKLFRNLDSENVGSRTTFDQIRLQISGPEGATVNSQHEGFDDKERNYSIRLSVVPMPFSIEFRNQLASMLDSYSIEPHYTRDIKVDGTRGGYFFGSETVRSTAGEETPQPKLKHMISFGNESYTWVVAASFPKSRESELSQMLLNSVMSTKIDGTDFPEIRGNEFGYSIIKPPGLKFCKGWGEKYVLTGSGQFPVRSPEECFAKFEERVFEKPFEKSNQLPYTVAHLKAAPTIAVNRISMQKKITVDDLPGYEVIGVGREELSNTPVFLYSAVLFGESNAYCFSSWYGMRNESMDQLDDLKTLMRSFRRTKK